MRGDAKYVYPALELAIIRSRKKSVVIAEAIGLRPDTWSRRRHGMSEWRLGEMLDLQVILAPTMTLDELFHREAV